MPFICKVDETFDSIFMYFGGKILLSDTGISCPTSFGYVQFNARIFEKRKVCTTLLHWMLYICQFSRESRSGNLCSVKRAKFLFMWLTTGHFEKLKRLCLHMLKSWRIFQILVGIPCISLFNSFPIMVNFM